jgi:hypothetical protein
LRPDSDERQEFWSENVNDIQGFLDEVNSDVFDGQGKYKPIARFKGVYSNPPQIQRPYLFLEVKGKGAIAICTASEFELRVIAECSLGMGRWQSWECTPNKLEKHIEYAIKFVIG